MDVNIINRQYSEKPKRQKILRTIFLVLVWVCLGLYLEITGPTLIDLKIRTGADYEEVAVAVSGRSLGYFIGSAKGGVLVDRFVGFCDLMIGVCLTGGAIATVFVPWSRVVQLVWFFTVVQGTFEGVINIAGQKLIMMMWQENSASPLNLLHGGFGVGSFIIPLIANPFLAIIQKPSLSKMTMGLAGNLSMYDQALNFQSKHNYSMNVGHPMANATEGINGTRSVVFTRESRIEIAYIISAVITIALSVVFYVYHVNNLKEMRLAAKEKNNALIRKQESTKRKIKAMINPATCTDGNLLYGIAIFGTLFIYYFNIVGGERILGKFIRAYSIEQLDFSVDEGSLINFAFWISFAVGRFSGFLAARWIPIRILILIETGGVLVFSVLLNIFGSHSRLALWILVQPLALFHAPCFPSCMGWGNYHVEMTGMAICFLLLGGSLGGIAYLKLTGYLFETYGPRAFLYHVMGYGIAAFTLAVILDLIGAKHGNRFANKSDAVPETEMETLGGAKNKYDDEVIATID